MSAQIRLVRDDYYNTLERAQKSTMDVTNWQEWFLGCPIRAIEGAKGTLATVLFKAQFWEKFAAESLNERQIKVLNRLLDGFEDKLTTSEWAKLTKCSQDTAYRYILDLMDRETLVKNPAGDRSANYDLATI